MQFVSLRKNFWSGIEINKNNSIFIVMIRLKHLLSEIHLVGGDASTTDMKDMFDSAFDKSILPKKYRNLYQSTSDEANAIPQNQVTRETLKFLDKYEKVGNSGNYIMILKKRGSELEFLLCDKGAKYLTEFFIGVIKAQKGVNKYNFTPDKAFNLKTYQIQWANIADEHKGNGLGKLMYKMVYEYVSGPLGAALVSDSSLFQGSQRMWMQFIPDIASFFGIVVQDVFFPIDRSEIGASIGSDSVGMMVAMETIPTEIRKIIHNVKGLSFKGGEYGVIRVRDDINKKIAVSTDAPEKDFNYDSDNGVWIPKKNKNFQYTHFSNLVDEAITIYGLVTKMENLDMNVGPVISNTDNITNLKACIFTFNNMNVIIKKTGGKLVMVAI
jgi:hypothetical protein